MLFHSFEFLGVFLPVVIAGFYLTARTGRTDLAIYFLTAASVVFYGWWNWTMTGLLVASILVNYLFGRTLSARPRKPVLVLAVTLNLALLGWFKYANFFADSVNALTASSFTFGEIILPIGISFFTFQQVAFLVDAYRGLANEPNLGRYGLFVAFFPQLIAGPIVHHSEILPQYAHADRVRLTYDNVSVGVAIFVIGLFKKVVLADPVGNYADIVFDAARHGDAVSFISAWTGSAAFGLEIYFDFSGYSDMAIGLARIFAIRLPLNFESPYKATSIIDFWRRWHLTLSRFLRDYLYFPLGGNRKGRARRFFNVMIVMLLGGLWHGAAWTFVAWGALHGAFLVVNHAWRAMRQAVGWRDGGTRGGRLAGQLLTLLAVIFAWALFRAEGWDSAVVMVQGMSGASGIFLPESYALRLGPLAPLLEAFGVIFGTEPDPAIYPTLRVFLRVVALYVFVLVAPNTQQWIGAGAPSIERAATVTTRLAGRLRWRANAATGALFAGVFAVALGFLLQFEASEFVYFQF